MKHSESQRAEFRQARKAFEKLSIPDLIELLASENLQTRFLAEMVLRDATNT